MSSSEILLNSAALHSLKRSQLTKLCKRYGLKATGKNVDIIERLQEYAKSLSDREITSFDIPTSDLLEDGFELEDEDEESSPVKATRIDIATPRASGRTSEPWSIIEGDSREEENIIPGQSSRKSPFSLSVSMGEFGSDSAGTSKNNSVGSSIKAFASTLKRAASQSLLSKHSSSHSLQSGSLPEHDLFADSYQSPSPSPEPELPLPSTYCPDPVLASSSIRLIPSCGDLNKLAASGEPTSSASLGSVDDPVEAELDPDSSHKRASSIYPELPEFARANIEAAGVSITPGGFPSFAFDASSPSSPNVALANWEGSSHPTAASPPDNAAKAATTAAILDEMNRRMGVTAGVEGAITLSIFDRQGPLFSGNPITGPVLPRGAERFEKSHQGMFNQMDSIVNHWAAKRPPTKARKSLGKTRPSGSGRIRSSLSATPAAAKRRSRASMAGQRVIRPSTLVPEKKAPVSSVQNSGASKPSPSHIAPIAANNPQLEATRKQVTISTPTTDVDMFDASSTKPVLVVRPGGAEKKRLDQAKARKRSSLGRASTGKATIVGSTKSASGGLASKFLKSSAKLVKSVWGAATGVGSRSARDKATSSTKATTSPATSRGPLAKDTVHGQPRTASNAARIANRSTPTATSATRPSRTLVTSPPPLGSPQPIGRPLQPRPTNATRVSSLGARAITTARPGPAVIPSSHSKVSMSSAVSNSRLSSRPRSSASVAGTPVSASSGPPAPLNRPFAPPPTRTTVRTSNVTTSTTSSNASRPTPTPTFTNFTFTTKPAPPAPVWTGAKAPIGVRKLSTLTAPTAASRARQQPAIKVTIIAKENHTNAGAASFGQNTTNNKPAPNNPPTSRPLSPSKIPARQTSPPGNFLGSITNTVNSTNSPAPAIPKITLQEATDSEFGLSQSGSGQDTVSSRASASIASHSSSMRRPRISRAKVIAKLGEKRALEEAATVTNSTTPKPSRGLTLDAVNEGKADISCASITGAAVAGLTSRATLSPKLQTRRSHGAGIGGTSTITSTPRNRVRELAVEASARKAIRKSEAARRRSRAALRAEWTGVTPDRDVFSSGDSMNVRS
ncbi:hypothetical protein FRB99_004584 [Tulasnella sp. 403]|nr:hypothetical protein FRB99_004584 [Tulasnella sp. 403]